MAAMTQRSLAMGATSPSSRPPPTWSSVTTTTGLMSFVWERSTGTITRITDDDHGSHYPAVSADGRYVAFWGQRDVLVWDRTHWDHHPHHERQRPRGSGGVGSGHLG